MGRFADCDVVILCGGLGTRLQSVVADRPKSMTEIHGRPFVAWLVEHFLRHGARRFIFSTGYKGDMIALDAVFSPVLRVRFKVDGTRVGQETNLDKLSLTVDTDGTITPKEAFEEAAAVLVNQYTALAGSTTVVGAAALGTGADEDTGELSTSIDELGLTARTANALVNNDIRTVHDLVTLTEQELRELKGFGSKAFEEVKDKLAELEF